VSARFNRWVAWLLTWEGSIFENDPADPGGATKYGIDQRSHPNVNIKALTLNKAKAIYQVEAWDKCHAEALPPGVGEVLCNIAVNCGYGAAVRWLQEAVKTTVDGNFGPETLRKAQMSDAQTLCDALLNHTAQHYRDIGRGRLAKFLNGWLKRNASLADFIHSLLHP